MSNDSVEERRPVEERREMLEELADRDDLRVCKYAQALLDGDGD